MDYDILDVYDNIPKKKIYYPYTGSSCSTYIGFDKYLKDLCFGQETMEKARHQLSLDIPRCDFFINGEKCSIQDMVPDILVRFCTQSVMCVPLEMLMSHEYIIIDSKKRMTVEVCNTSVKVQKEMRVIKSESIVLPFWIVVNADYLEPYVFITIKFSQSLCSI